MTSTDERWARLDAPTKLALRWAWAWARTAIRATGPTAVTVRSQDVFVGLVLADLRASPARELLDHYGIPPGAVVSRDGRPLPSSRRLLAMIDLMPTGGMPPLSPTVRNLIDRLLASRTGPDDLVSMRELFGAWLAQADPVTLILRDQLAARGASLADIVRTYDKYLSSRMSYTDFLRQRFPRQPLRVDVPAYLADQPRAGEPMPLDLVGIRPDVDAFAYLIASTQLMPPLAIGLFGAWGAGKSHFMRSLRHRVDSVARAAEDATRPLPFHRNIVQIEFNAWQYVDGSLWASLLEHLFRNLRRSGDDSDELLAQRQEYWISRIQGVTAEHEAADRERERLAAERDIAAQAVADRRQERTEALAELEARARDHPFAGWRPSAELRDRLNEVAAEAGLDVVGKQGAELVAELDSARTALKGVSALLTPLRTGGPRYLAAVVLLLLLPPLITLVLREIDVSALTAVTATIASGFATLAGYTRMATNFVSRATKKLAAVQAELMAEQERQRQQLDERVSTAEQELDEAERALEAAIEAQRSLATEGSALNEELTAVTPRRVLSEFINDRMNSDDYRSHLGVPSLVRRDLQRLSQLVLAHHDNPADDPVPPDYAIDRIVLYIDDLDRCPTGLVIKVLEAVHMLMAFPLFVVVVAVDPRWLASSLRDHYAQLSGKDATPEDYLEKIFQVPFHVRPIDTDVRQQMLRGLLAPNLVRAEEPETESTEPDARVPDADLAEFRAVVESFATAGDEESTWLAASGLTVTAAELDTVENVADLIRPTPRATKRYANLYLLAKSMGTTRGWNPPPDGQLALLLAIAIGLPTLLPTIARRTGTPLPLGDLVTTFDQNGSLDLAAELAILNQWVDAKPSRLNLDMSGLSDWIELISRFQIAGPNS